jgi:hypothetical protein
MTVEMLPRVGQRFMVAVRPPDWYAGRIGDGAVVEESTQRGGVYVRFDSGLRETFPLVRFLEYFRPAVVAARERAAGPRLDTPWIERTPSGRILLHRTGATPPHGRSGTD